MIYFVEIVDKVIISLLDQKHHIKALYVFDKLQKRGVYPTHRGFSHLIDRMLKIGNEGKAKDLFAMYFSVLGKPEDSLFHPFIHYYLKTNRVHDGMSLVIYYYFWVGAFFFFFFLVLFLNNNKKG